MCPRDQKLFIFKQQTLAGAVRRMDGQDARTLQYFAAAVVRSCRTDFTKCPNTISKLRPERDQVGGVSSPHVAPLDPVLNPSTIHDLWVAYRAGLPMHIPPEAEHLLALAFWAGAADALDATEDSRRATRNADAGQQKWRAINAESLSVASTIYVEKWDAFWAAFTGVYRLLGRDLLGGRTRPAEAEAETFQRAALRAECDRFTPSTDATTILWFAGEPLTVCFLAESPLRRGHYRVVPAPPCRVAVLACPSCGRLVDVHDRVIRADGVVRRPIVCNRRLVPGAAVSDPRGSGECDFNGFVRLAGWRIATHA